MLSRYYKFCVRRLLVVLFLGSFALSLGLGYLPSTLGQVQWAYVAVAQSPDGSQWVEKGVELYQIGDITGAIAHSSLTVEYLSSPPQPYRLHQ
jgi:hypothetical protein